MHNRPTNNETNIIRNIFSKSLNEESMEDWMRRQEKQIKDTDYQLSRQAVNRLNQQPTPPAPLEVGQTRPEHLQRLMQDPRNLPYLLRTGQAKTSFQNPPAPKPDESGVVTRSYFVPQGVDPSNVNPDKPIQLPIDTAVNLARQKIEKETDVRFSEPSAATPSSTGYTRPSNLVGIPQQPSLFDIGMQQPAKPKTSEFELGPITPSPVQPKATPELTANNIIQQMKDIGIFGNQKKAQSATQPVATQPKQTGRWAGPQPDQPVYDAEGDFVGTSKMPEKEAKEKVLSTIKQITAPKSVTTQPKPEPAVTQPKREPIMITKMNASKEYELVPADLSKDEDLLRIQPGSASYGQLTPAEKARRESLANPSKSAPSPSSQTTTGRGRAPSPIPSADSFRAAYNTTGSRFSRNLSEKYYNILSEKLDLLEQEGIKGLNIGAYKSRKKAYRTAAKLVDPFYTGASGDSSSSGELESSADNSGSDVKQPSWGEQIAPHVITLMRHAQDHNIELSKEEAVNTRSEDHRRLLSMYPPGHEVHKASQAMSQIMANVRS